MHDEVLQTHKSADVAPPRPAAVPGDQPAGHGHAQGYHIRHRGHTLPSAAANLLRQGVSLD